MMIVGEYYKIGSPVNPFMWVIKVLDVGKRGYKLSFIIDGSSGWFPKDDSLVTTATLLSDADALALRLTGQLKI